MPKSDGHHTWDSDEIDKFRAAWPLGTGPRVALDIMLYTGMRISDAIKFAPENIKSGTFTFISQKTGIETMAPIVQPLAESLEATGIKSGPFIRLNNGEPVRHNYASKWFSGLCIDIKIKGRAHGLRKAGATLAAENGATPFELAALFGWSSTKMAETYTKKVDKARLASNAMAKLYPHQDKK